MSIRKKDNNQLTENYTPTSLLPITCKKICEKLICNFLFKYLNNNNLLQFYILINLGFVLAIHAFTNFYQLYMISTDQYDANPSLEVEVFS